jgi:hypothetical protein
MAFSDPLFVAGTSKRSANSQTWAALRLSRRARTSPGWLPLCQGLDRFTEIPKATPLVVAVAQPGQEGGFQAGLAGGPGGLDRGGRLAEGVACCLSGPDLGYRIDRVGVVEVAVQMGQTRLDPGKLSLVAEVAAVVVADQDWSGSRPGSRTR